jgi:ribosomal protein S18 acetylase RimI-like enzyme
MSREAGWGDRDLFFQDLYPFSGWGFAPARLGAMNDSVLVKAMEAADLDDVGRMAAALVHYHHGLDPRRFLLVDGVESGYKRYFASQLAEPNTVLLVALRGNRRVGYAYARAEPRDWNALLDVHGALHDIYVEQEERRGGVGGALLAEVKSRLTRAGAPRLVLSTAVQNEPAQRLFERHGFRRTMLEMTCELG